MCQRFDRAMTCGYKAQHSNSVQMKKDSDFLKRREEVARFNKKHKWVKRGISMTHCRSPSLRS